MLRDLSRSYLTIVKDLSRVMNRLKAVYCSWAIPCAGRDVYYTRHRAQWLAKIREAGVRRRAERLYEQLDMLQHLRQQARRELLAESRKHLITAKLRQIPFSGADSNGAGGGTDPDPTSFPHQAAALGLQRFRGRDSRQRRVPLCARQTATQPRAHDGARAECQLQLQQGSEESFQRGCHLGQHWYRQVVRCLRRTILGLRLFPGSYERHSQRWEEQWRGGDMTLFLSTALVLGARWSATRKPVRWRRTVLTIEDFRSAERQKPVQIWTTTRQVPNFRVADHPPARGNSSRI